MRTERYDVVVIGAGPAGSRTAAVSAGAGLSTLLLEKRERIGFPVRCGEAVGPRAEVERFLPLDIDLVCSPIDGFALVSPAGARFEGHMPGIGLVIDRERFDRRLAQAAEGAGAVVRTEHQATGLVFSGPRAGGALVDGSRVGGALVRDLRSGETYRAEAAVTVGADGVECHSPRWAGLKPAYRPHEVMACAQELVEGIDLPGPYIEFHLGRRFAPGGYAWVFPKGPARANVGVGVNPCLAGGASAAEYLERFLEHRCPGAARTRFIAGGTVVARGLRRLATGGYLAVGEAANQNNPFSGGGIINALEGADLAAEALIEALLGEGPSKRALGRYTRSWKRSTGRANEQFWHAAQAFYHLSDDDMEKALGRIRSMRGLFDAGGVDAGKLLRGLLGTRPRLIFALAGGLVKGYTR